MSNDGSETPSGESAVETAETPAETASTETASTPSIEIPDGFAYAKDDGIDFDAWTKDAEELASLRKAREGVPESPDAYAIEPGDDWKYPDGSAQSFDENDPFLGELKALAHELGAGPDAFGKLAELMARVDRGQAEALHAKVEEAKQEAEQAVAREMATLVDAKNPDSEAALNGGLKELENLENQLITLFPQDDLGKTAAKAVTNAAQVRVLKTLMEHVDADALGGSKPAGNGLADMTPEEKIAFALTQGKH